MSLDRRHFLAAAGGAVVGLVGESSIGGGARARAPVSRSQAPGFYRFSLGQFQLTVVSDGTIAFPAEALWPEAPKAERDAVLASDFQPTDKSTLQVNVLAVNTGIALYSSTQAHGERCSSSRPQAVYFRTLRPPRSSRRRSTQS